MSVAQLFVCWSFSSNALIEPGSQADQLDQHRGPLGLTTTIAKMLSLRQESETLKLNLPLGTCKLR